MRQRRCIELLSDYDCEIRYHPRKANVVAEALSRKERVKPLRVQALAKNLGKMIKQIFEIRSDEYQCFDKHVWLPRLTGLRDLIIYESHKSKYSIHSGSDKMYHDLKQLYWWPNMKVKIVTYVSKFMTCAKVKEECQSRLDYFNNPRLPYRNRRESLWISSPDSRELQAWSADIDHIGQR
ncbi:putative reverse transcriptase domain-containing protein [Tanacetum coccineum]